MITVNSIKINALTQYFYENFIKSINFASLTCSCNHSSCLIKHGYYKRTIKVAGETKETLTILRVKCANCGRTHAIFPILIVPYSQVLLTDHLEIINNYINSKKQDSIMTQKILIDENTVRYIISNFIKYWKQRIISFNIALNQPLDKLCKTCIEILRLQFMQIKCTQNIFSP